MYLNHPVNYGNTNNKMMTQQRYANNGYDSDDADSICHELAYDKVDCQQGHYSDAGYQSPGLNLDHSSGEQGLFTPVEVPSTRIYQQKEATSVNGLVDFVNSGHRLYKIPSSCMTQNAVNFDMPSKGQSQYSSPATTTIKQFANNKSQCKSTGDFTSHQRLAHNNMKSCIQNSDFFYVPQDNMLHYSKHQSSPDNSDLMTKEENISPMTLSSGYSSDKEEALRQLDLEYNSDASDHSPKLKPRSLHLSSKQTTVPKRAETKDNYIIRPDEYYPNIDDTAHQYNSKSQPCYDQAHKSEWRFESANKNSGARSEAAPLKGHMACKSKGVAAADNRRNSIAAVNPSCLNSLEQVNASLSSLVITSSSCQVNGSSMVYPPKGTPSKTSAIMDSNQNMTTTSNDSISKVERLPVITSGESFQHISGILMAPEASSHHCWRCPSSFSSQRSHTIQGPSPDCARVLSASKNSAFRPVKSSSRSKSTPPREGFNNTEPQLSFRSGEGLVSAIPDYIADDIHMRCPPHLLKKRDSQVTSLSEDSGRGSATSIDLALNDSTPSIYGGSMFPGLPEAPRVSTPIYQDIPRGSEQIYESVPEVFNQSPIRRPRPEDTPPRLPRRNPRTANSHMPSSKSLNRKATSSLVTYEDIVKPQDIVDASAMHMYTVADVLQSVDLLASDIPQSSNNEMCVHENYAHFVSPAASNKQRVERSSSQTSIKDLKPHFSIYQNANHTNTDSMISHEVMTPHDLSLPIRPRQNTACEAQKKRLTKTEDEPQTLCHSPCVASKNLSRSTHQYSAPHTFPRDAPKRRQNKSGLTNKSPSLSNLNLCAPNHSITWSTARGNMTEVYC